MRTHCITIDLANQGRRQVRARFDGGRMSSDGGALLLQAVDQRIGLTRRLAACFVDHRNPRRCEHSLQRLFGLALGYEDLCDHDRGHPLAGSSTLNRLELGTPEQAPQDRYKRIVADPQRLGAAGGAVPGQPRRGAGGDRLGCERDRRPAARPVGGAFLPRLLRLLLLPPAVCDLRATPAVRAAATVQPGRGGRAVEELQRIVGQIRQRASTTCSAWPRTRG